MLRFSTDWLLEKAWILVDARPKYRAENHVFLVGIDRLSKILTWRISLSSNDTITHCIFPRLPGQYLRNYHNFSYSFNEINYGHWFHVHSKAQFGQTPGKPSAISVSIQAVFWIIEFGAKGDQIVRDLKVLVLGRIKANSAAGYEAHAIHNGLYLRQAKRCRLNLLISGKDIFFWPDVIHITFSPVIEGSQEKLPFLFWVGR